MRVFLVGLLSAALLGSACGRSSPPARRSLILVTIDTLRPDHVNAQTAPALDQLSREAIAFDTAIAVGPLTLPGHASLLTGLYPPAHGVRDNHLFSLPKETPTYTAWLKARGYATAAFVSAIVLDRRYGLDAGFDTYDDAMPASGAGGTAPERDATDTLQRATGWLDQQAAVRPFFLWIHLFEPHAPYRTGSYAGEVTAVDRALDAFFTTLRARGLWNDVVLSVTSDHGESLGEHGEQTHGFFVYDATIRIPWILKAPGLAARRVAAQVRLVDVMPTMIALAGADASGADGAAAGANASAHAAAAAPASAPPLNGVHGESLARYLQGGSLPALEAYSETWLPRHQFNWSELKAMRTAQFKYIAAPEAELYALPSDPAEAHNVVATQPEASASLRKMIDGLERESLDPGGLDPGGPAAGGPDRTGVDRSGSAPMRAPAARRQSSDIVEAEKFLALGYIGHSPAAAPARGETLPDPKRKVEIYRLVMSALELSEAGKPDAAIAALHRAAALDPAVTQVHYLQGVIHGGQSRYAEAAKALERTVTLNPRHVLARFKLALAYLRLGRAPEAERALQTVIQDEPRNVRAHHNLAALAYARGDLARAETLERQALAIDESYFEAWNTLGAIFVVTKRPTEAVQALRRATTLNPSSGQAQYNLALALNASGDAGAARTAAERACALERSYCR